MATNLGNVCLAKAGSTWAAGVAIGELRSVTREKSCVLIDDSALADAVDTFKSGSKTGSIDITAWLDPRDTTGQGALVVGAEVILHLAPEGGDSGDTYETVTCIVERENYSANRNAVSERSFTLRPITAFTPTIITP